METSMLPVVQPCRTAAWQRSTKAVVISLRRSATRQANVQAILRNCPLACEIWDATDGSLLTPELVASVYQPELHQPTYPFVLRPGEIGCFLSHRRIWQMMVDRQIERLLVVEDDVAFLPNFTDTLKHSIEYAADGNYVQFQVRNLSFPEHSLIDQAGPALLRPILAPLRTSAQLVTLGAAQRLLQFWERFDRPVDAAIQLTWKHGAEVLVAVPRSVIEVSETIGGSTITSRKQRRPLMQTIFREWNRARYRQRIARCAHQFTQK